MIEIMKTFNKDNNDSYELNRFFNLLSRYNRRIPIPDNLREEIENHLSFRWNNNKNHAMTTEEDIRILSELPEEVRSRI